ncbi:MAG: 1-acyl-sn-glycerol-3-phosphate acyltransferase [Anaerolineaceae bacterium]|jgi:1-acyl-sn-glycerol-3-phosphate acyltransferase|nr:1-acyl-sn-glycerol-3-phosphate acyltransferase [Anaerolineaceae bacterium]
MVIVRKIVRTLVYILVRMLTRSELIGLENIPDEGGIILATNHMSRIDLPVLMMITYVKRTDITALVTTKYRDHLIFRLLLDLLGAFWIDRTKADFAAFRKAVDFLKDGGLVGISPEGTRSKTGVLIEGKSGIVIIAEKADVPIVPVGIAGTEDAASAFRRLRRPRIVVRVGESFRISPLERNNRNEILQGNTDEIMCRIAAQLPGKYHGFYRDYPRLKEFLKDGV